MFVGELLHDRIIGALELLIQNKRVNWDTHQIGIPGATAKDKEDRRIPFNPNGRLTAVLTRRAKLGPDAYVCGSAHGAHGPTLQTGPKCRFVNARPEPVLRYRSNRLAAPASANSIATTTDQGRW
jgi:hypothetical protein